MRVNSVEQTVDRCKELDDISIDDIANYYFSLDIQDGFIEHPQSIPFKVEEVSPELSDLKQQNPSLGLGIRFKSKKKLTLNSWIKLTILLKEKEHCFLAKVVMIKCQENEFTIGVWIDDNQDVKRLRTLQQYCHLENYIREKHADSESFNIKGYSDFMQSVFPSI